MNEPKVSLMQPYKYHVLICVRNSAAEQELGERLQRRLNELRQIHNMTDRGRANEVICSLADFPNISGNGPVLVVYPDGIWYHNVDEPALERIYQEHLLDGQPLEALILYRLYPQEMEQVTRGDTTKKDEEIEEESFPITGISPAIPSTSSNPKKTIMHIMERIPTDDEAIRAVVHQARKKKGLVIVNTGNGKGKTTAALGVMTRAWGRKMKIGVIQFLKSETARFGEIKATERMGDIDWFSIGDGWTWASEDLDASAVKAQDGWSFAQECIVSGNYDLLILDEFTYTMHFGWLDPGKVVNWLKANKPEMLHLIITGRDAPEALIEYADLVTEMREIKHPFKEQGVRAQAGIEY